MAAVCTFDESLPNAVAAVREFLPETQPEAFRFVRDMTGQIHVVVPDITQDSILAALRDRLAEILGPYGPGGSTVVVRASDTLDGEALFRESFLIVIVENFKYYLIERRALGQDWVVQPDNQNDHPPRFAFYSIKGGVGRSTALLLWGRHLAAQGKKVLLIDLDLEAPGLGAQLLSFEGLPKFGVLDWLVEDLSGGADDQLIATMTADSPISEDPGLVVVPALGAQAEQYPHNVIAKLARAYLEGEDNSPQQSGFASRLRHMIERLEGRVRPDVVLIDSRAGLHETVAANLLHLDAEVLLFAVDLPVNWRGYRYLFNHLKQLAQSAAPGIGPVWRERFKMVHARAEGTTTAGLNFASSSYNLWTDTLYDEVAPEVAPEVSLEPFSFDQGDPGAPHWPYSILRSERLERFNPLEDLDILGEQPIREAFIGFFKELDEWLEALNYG